MENILLVMLFSLLDVVFAVAMFCFGWLAKTRFTKEEDKGIELNDNNKDFVEEMIKWKNFKGGK